jgi:hypothetical protein
MAHAGTNTRGHQALLAVVTQDLGQSAELRQAEVMVRKSVKNKSGTE